MSTFNISRTRSALAVVALMACAAAAHAAPGDLPPMKDAQAPQMTDRVPGAATDNKVGQAVSDSWITTKVKSEILANSASKGLKVEVITKAGVVSLNGKLPSQDAVAMVKAIAESVKGVQRVDVSGLAIESAS